MVLPRLPAAELARARGARRARARRRWLASRRVRSVDLAPGEAAVAEDDALALGDRRGDRLPDVGERTPREPPLSRARRVGAGPPCAHARRGERGRDRRQSHAATCLRPSRASRERRQGGTRSRGRRRRGRRPRGRPRSSVAPTVTESECRAAGVEFASRGSTPRRGDGGLPAALDRARRRPRGAFFRFEPVMFEPKPVQKPHPPLLVGGESPAALRRAAREGDGWLASTTRRTRPPRWSRACARSGPRRAAASGRSP